jgi:hypothetical protein
MAKDAYYFSHDSNARNDIKIKAMIAKYGYEGYGMYWVVIEMLRETKDYELPLEEYTFLALQQEFNGCSTDVQQYINDCINTFKLFSSDGEMFWSESLKRRMIPLDAKREQARQAGLASAEKRRIKKENEQTSNDRSTDAEQLNKSKVNKKIEKDIYGGRRDVFDYYLSLDLIKHKKYTPAMDMAIKTAMKNNGYTIEDCKKLLDRHKQTVEATKGTQYPVRARPLHEFFGQKAYQAKHLICAEYEEGGKYYNVTPKREEPQPSYFKPLEYEYED